MRRGFTSSKLILAAVVCLQTTPAAAQRPIDPQTGPGLAVVRQFERDLAASGDSLTCSVKVVKPNLNFAFRYQTGFVATLPIDQFKPEGRLFAEDVALTATLRVRPEKASVPLFFQQLYKISQMPEDDFGHALAKGGIEIGEGNYDIDLVLRTEDGNIYRKSWQIRHELSDEEREISMLGPGEVEPLKLVYWNRGGEVASRPFRVSVLVHATPLLFGSVRLRKPDLAVLYSVVSSLCESPSFDPSSITAFNLKRQDVIFHATFVNGPSLIGLLDRLASLNTGTVGLQNLEDPEGRLDLLEDMVQKEAESKDPPDAIVIVGPATRQKNKVDPDSGRIEKLRNSGIPPVFLLKPNLIARYEFPDAVEEFTKAVGGRVLSFGDPKGLAKAFFEIEDDLSQHLAERARKRGLPVSALTQVRYGQPINGRSMAESLH